MTVGEFPGWDRLRHGGLLLDPPRLRRVAEYVPDSLSPYHERELRREVGTVLEGGAIVSDFVRFVLEEVCGFNDSNGAWQRGSNLGSEWSRGAVTGETVKPRQIWKGPHGAILPVFIDTEKRLGIGRGRKTATQTVHWLRSGPERLALLTNGRQWRLVFAGLDFDAWCEWDVDLWFEEGALSPQVDALRRLVAPALWTPSAKDGTPALVELILDSRKGQAELSAVLGERVREAVELLVQSHGDALTDQCSDVDPSEIYRAAARVVMRMVVVLFAESRELLPRDVPLYHGAYGLTGLLGELERISARGGNRLARSWNAWPRVLALFRLVHQGSHHPALPVPAYGGELFAPGDPASEDGPTRALTVFETACFDRELLPDRGVHRMLEWITRTRVKVRQGRSSTWVAAPVDFSDLSSEYIGILYEGLLDFELRTAPDGDPMAFLAVGNQPVLPLSRLEAMDDKALANLLEKLKDTSSGDAEGDAELAEPTDDTEITADDDETEDEDAEPDEPAADVADEEKNDADDERHTTRTRAERWARRAVEVGKLARKPRGNVTPEKQLAYDEAVARKARQLVLRVVLPGEWYVVRWGGTRKGSGTFYTRPGLAVPTVQRTLRPLAYTSASSADAPPDQNDPPPQWTPRIPEDILALKVCDPACGSGTFPVAALRFLTEALYASLHYHGRVSADRDRAVVRLLGDVPAEAGVLPELLGQELLPCRPDDALFEPRLKAILRRHIVERSIYGVDVDPLAVELCRVALWIETMDRTLPFSFLDHKIKCGNGLLGAWFDQFPHYPVMAWKNREGGDKNHNNGVHFEKEARTKAIKVFVKDRLTPDLRRFLEGATLLSEDMQEQAAAVHTEALSTLARLHDLPVHDSADRARIYRDELVGSAAYRSLKCAMDLWCACWFWPAEELEYAPLPTAFVSPKTETRAIAVRVAAVKRFFHWELEFPDVFRSSGAGFDALIGNPPWNVAKPNSKEFFSSIDPLYRSHGKQQALRAQTDCFVDEHLEREWLDYITDFRAQSNYMAYAANPFGDPAENHKSQDRFSIARGNENAHLHARWRDARSRSNGFGDPAHSFRHQGSADLNLYKAFLEQAHALLRNTGRLGFIVPAGIYSDYGTRALRQLFLDCCRWEWLFGFENHDGIFDIHRSSKFNPIIVEKGGTTESIRTSFMRRKLEDWECAESLTTPYARAQVERFSPNSHAILEIQSLRDIEILEEIYANSVLFGDDGPERWGIEYATEFHMTNDSKLFPPCRRWEAEGYRPDEYSRWLKGDWRSIAELYTALEVTSLPEHERRCAQAPYDTLSIPRADIPEGIILSREADSWLRECDIEDVAVPLMQGAMVSQFDFMASAYESGAGQNVRWRTLDFDQKLSQPQFLMAADTFRNAFPAVGNRIGFRGLSNPTNRRTWISSIIPHWPCGNMLPILRFRDAEPVTPHLFCALTNSYVYDYQIRKRFSGTGAVAITLSALGDTALPLRTAPVSSLAFLAIRLALLGPCMAEDWLQVGHLFTAQITSQPWRALQAFTWHERTRLASVTDAVAAATFGLALPDLSSVLTDCDYPRGELVAGQVPTHLDQKGFWRVDKDMDPELRHTILTLVAFEDLEAKIHACGGERDKGIETFLAQNDGEGWMLPESLRLADYGLGRDHRAKEHQPVASRLGPRFYDWQLAQSVEESWRECHLHARNLLGETRYQQLLAESEADTPEEPRRATTAAQVAGTASTAQGALFE